MESHFPNMDESRGQQARERVMDDLRALAADAEELLRATADDVGGKAKEARERLTAAVDRAKSSYQEFQAQGIESARAAARKADDTIRAHPYESLAVALGVGILIGVLLRRK